MQFFSLFFASSYFKHLPFLFILSLTSIAQAKHQCHPISRVFRTCHATWHRALRFKEFHRNTCQYVPRYSKNSEQQNACLRHGFKHSWLLRMWKIVCVRNSYAQRYYKAQRYTIWYIPKVPFLLWKRIHLTGKCNGVSGRIHIAYLTLTPLLQAPVPEMQMKRCESKRKGRLWRVLTMKKTLEKRERRCKNNT